MRMSTGLLVIATVSFLTGCSSPAPATRYPISPEAAVAKAEKFVAREGYTKNPPVYNRIQEDGSMDYNGPPSQEEYASRHDTLEPKAFGLSGDSVRGWTVYFRFSEGGRKKHPDIDPNLTGCAVGMNEYGSSIWISLRASFKYIAKKLQN